MTAIEQIKRQCMFAGKLDEEQQKLFSILERLYFAAQSLLGDLQDAGQDVNPETGATWSIFTELDEALTAVNQGLVVSRTVVVEVESTLDDDQIKQVFATAVGNMKDVSKPRIMVKGES